MKRAITITIKGLCITEEEKEQLKRYIEVYCGKYTPTQQYAASLLMKMLLKGKYKILMEGLKEATGYKVNNRMSGKVVTWAKKIKQKGKCEVCGASDKLEAHHIVPWEYSISGRTDINNGQCLCEKCHKMMHNDEEWTKYMMGGE